MKPKIRHHLALASLWFALLAVSLTAEAARQGFQDSQNSQNSKIDPRVRGLIQALEVEGITLDNAGLLKASRLSNFFVHVDDRAFIQTYLHVEDLSPEQLDLLRKGGAELEIHNTDLDIVQAWIPFNRIDTVAELSFVLRITPPSYGVSRLASCVNNPSITCTTEGVAIHRSDELQALGFDGSGVKVGVISDGVDSLCTAVSKDELPGGITVFGTCNDSDPCSCNDGDEGVAMLEIVHDMAPGAALGFGAGLGSTLEFIDRVEDLMTTFGADIIVDDLGFFLEPYFEDGPVAQKVAEAVGNGILYASAAGNEAVEHYEGEFVDSGDGLHSHQISPGNNVFNVSGSNVAVIVQWTNPFGGSGDNYDLCLQSETQVQCSDPTRNTQQNGDDDPVEFDGFFCGGAGGCPLQVRLVSGSPQRIELFVLGGSLSVEDQVTAGSIFGHPAVVGAMATGAIRASDPGNDDVEFFSSQGAVDIFFPAPETRNKPDISAVDGVEVGGFGGFPSPFYGTSAAAPHVAGGAAQLMQGFTTAAEIRTALMDSAVDIETAGFDFLSGAGRMDLFEAAKLLNDPPNSVINTPSTNVTINQGNTVNFTGTCTDPNNMTGMSFLWAFESGSGISNKTVEDPGSTQFNNAGQFDVTFTCTDGFGEPDPTPDTRTITVQSGPPPPDDDGDGIPNGQDNCPLIPNANQANLDGDSLGDVCDPDDDNDGVADVSDNCPLNSNANQANNDGDGQGDVCDPDDDNDSVLDGTDNCPLIANNSQTDADGDGLGDPCDPNNNDGPLGDLDSDTIVNQNDNCPTISNANQANNDGDSQGDVCDPDDDNDGVSDDNDNCSLNSNANQANNDGDGQGDVCDPDDDNDSVLDGTDNCPLIANGDQTNLDGDSQGDACDSDDDNDGASDGSDNCPLISNPDQQDTDGDGAGDACDSDSGTNDGGTGDGTGDGGDGGVPPENSSPGSSGCSLNPSIEMNYSNN